ncbi:DNA-binding response regulator [Alteromonas sediminis]|uniref:DNA-binding response regulator n=1 Tax=Alteromonas sediminis TaxID=2259342 RepID=A0A3N5Y1P9_9ALTE|nr:response regulator transcription factor [Alteromonas sediminis]RPJ67130.1 DNA-binding response regulator [Alteromonas sediminis]
MNKSGTPILIVDDHPLFRSALCQALSDKVSGDFIQADTFDKAISILEQNNDIELVLLDLNLPGVVGLNGLVAIRAQFPGVLVAIVSANEAHKTVQGALALGACGYIPKSSSLETLHYAISQILDGEIWVPEELAESVEGDLDPQTAALAHNIAQLTPHQLQVLNYISAGLLNKQIAYELQISESTVKQHVSAVLRKLQVINRTQAGILFKQLMSAEQDADSDEVTA